MAKKGKTKRGMAKKGTMKQISIVIEPEQLAKLKQLSENTMAPINALVRKAVDDYLELRKADIRK
jgi:predicted DNA-binding protein